MARAILRPYVRWLIAMALVYAGTGVLSCYDHLHPPATPGGNPADFPPLTDSKAPRGHDTVVPKAPGAGGGAGPSDGGVPRS